MTHKYNSFIRPVFYIVEILLLYCITQAPGLYLTSLRIKPCLLIPVAVCIAMLESQTMGLMFGMICGIMMDVGMGSFGFYAIILCVICYIIGVLATDLIKTNIFTVTLSSAFASIILLFLSFLFFYVLKGYSDADYAFVNHYIPIIIFSVIPSPIIYFLNKLLFLAFSDGSEN